MKTKDLSFYITSFFSYYLVSQRNVSQNTVKAYRDTFLLLFSFMSSEKGIRADKLEIDDINRASILSFLDWLEQERHNSAATRNQRLAAIHAFFKYLQAENVEFVFQCKQILSIPFKRHAKPLVQHLEENELKTILQMPDTTKMWGRRDLVLLCLLYDTGARVQEIIDLTVGDIRLEAPATVKLSGKGRKRRTVPLMSQTTQLLKNYLEEQKLTEKERSYPVFFNKQRKKLTRKGIAYILGKYVKQAAEVTSMPTFNITPHVFRHTKAMHLLNADVNMFYIRDILGHVDISTTEIYARVDAEKKRGILEKISNNSVPSNLPPWQKDQSLMNWLKGFA